ncbi:hypothetical protein FRC16_002106 [Serendipita sp. 398]|nr:hypothetical protein FRC16_002106 [Serendipita sp. 398]
MSIARTFFNEHIPLLRMLNDPFLLRPSFSSLGSNGHRRRYQDPFFDNFNWMPQPSLHVSEENGAYVVEADVPGVKKENLDVRIGDGGRSLTVSGKITRGNTAVESSVERAGTGEAASNASTEDQLSKVDDSKKQAQAANEQGLTGTSTFSRTVWLPNPIDSSTVRAKLEDGVLMIKASRTNVESLNVVID